MKERIKEILRGYVLPSTLVGATLLLGTNVVAHAVKINFTEPNSFPKHAIEVRESPLPRDRLEFLGPYSCNHIQYAFPDKVEDQLESKLAEKSKAFMDELGVKRYFPAPNAVQRLKELDEGRGYDLGVNEASDKWILTYRTSETSRPFRHGFTLIEHGTNQSVKDRFGPDYNPKEGEMNYFVMSPNGLIDYVVNLDSGGYENCLAFRPQQEMFRVWLRGGPWEDLVFSRTQKQVARKLEDIARNPNYAMFRSVK